MGLKLNYNLLIKSASILLVLYLLGVISITIIGQNKLKKAQENEFNLQVENSILSVESFLEIQKENILQLSENRIVESYFINKALGMSLQYGLRANILKIDRLFEEFLKKKKINGFSVFHNVALLDKNMLFISKNSFDINLKAFENIKNQDISLVFYMKDNKLETYLAKKITINTQDVGLIIAKLNFKDIVNKLLKNLRKEHFIYLYQNQKVFFIEDLKLLLDKGFEESDMKIDSILNSNLKLMVKENKKEAYLTSIYFTLGLIFLSFILLYGIYYIFRLDKKNTLLNIRIKDTNKMNKILEEKVEEKTQELQEFNNHLKNRIKEEIDKNRENQRILYNQSKMAMMGQMLDNIAHQWRQPLSSISTSASGVKLQNELEILNTQLLEKSMDNIVDSTKFLSETIEDFRDFFKENRDKQHFRIKHTYEKTRKLLISVMKNTSIEVIENIEDVEIKGYSNELIQVLLNILNNAYDAFKLGLDTEHKKLIFVDIYKNENFAIIRIKDSAGGIPKKIIDKVFDARFTTKGESNGTGIGLYMTKEIVESHMKGSIKVKNRVYTYEDIEYSGAEFIIKIPIES